MQLQHLLGIEYLTPQQINTILDLADHYANKNRTDSRNSNVLSGCTQVNMFFENSTRTQASFEIAGKRLGADVMNMSMEASSVKKGETLVDTALTLNAMHPDQPHWVKYSCVICPQDIYLGHQLNLLSF